VQDAGVVKLATVIIPSTIWDFPAALILGAFGGMFGAFYIFIN
jgi:chloride channel 7